MGCWSLCFFFVCLPLLLRVICCIDKPDLGGNEASEGASKQAPTVRVVDYDMQTDSTTARNSPGNESALNNDGGKTRIDMLNVDDLLIMRSSFECKT